MTDGPPFSSPYLTCRQLVPLLVDEKDPTKGYALIDSKDPSKGFKKKSIGPYITNIDPSTGHQTTTGHLSSDIGSLCAQPLRNLPACPYVPQQDTANYYWPCPSLSSTVLADASGDTPSAPAAPQPAPASPPSQGKSKCAIL